MITETPAITGIISSSSRTMYACIHAPAPLSAAQIAARNRKHRDSDLWQYNGSGKPVQAGASAYGPA